VSPSATAPPSAVESPSASAGGSASAGPNASDSLLPPTTSSGVRSVVSAAVSPFADCTAGGTGTLAANSEVEPTIAVDPRRPSRVVVAWQQDRWSNGAARGIVAASSADGGRSWARSIVPFSACAAGPATSGLPSRASDPWLSIGPDGTAYLAALATTPPNVSWVSVSRSTDGGMTWSTPVPVAQSTTSRAFNDKEAVTADPKRAGRAWLVWDQNGAGETESSGQRSPAGSVLLSTTTDAGRTWSSPRAIATVAGTPVGNIVAAVPDGTLVDVFVRAPASPQGRAEVMSLRSTDDGATWSEPATIATLAGANVIGAQPPGVRGGGGLPSVAVDPGSGTIRLAWADPSAHPASISLAASIDGGASWSVVPPLPRPATSPVFLASTAVAASGAIAVGYTDLRAATSAAPFLADRILTVSADGGATWRERRLTSTFDLATAPNAGGRFLGDYSGLVSSPVDWLSAFAVTTGDVSNPTDLVVRVDPLADPSAVPVP